jgi:DMSO/TMAO reductase YedYZ molybdopterin-dependent catalytic subunit
LSREEARATQQISVPVTMDCGGIGRAGVSPHVVSQPWVLEAVGTAEWTGIPLRGLLEEAGLTDGAVELVFEGLDSGIDGGVEQHYARSLTIEQAMADDVLLAHTVNGDPLPPQHGFPLRLVVPGWYGMTSVKWLRSITAVREPFAGYQQAQAYRMRRSEDEDGEPVSLIAPRALMIPPGIPDFLTRSRLVDRGPVRIEGRAWSGRGDIAGVEFSVDGGGSWAEAELGESAGRHAWRGWSYLWEPAAAGAHELCCRGRDAAGNRQPLHAAWNVGGYANNAVQRVAVAVR